MIETEYHPLNNIETYELIVMKRREEGNEGGREWLVEGKGETENRLTGSQMAYWEEKFYSGEAWKTSP